MTAGGLTVALLLAACDAPVAEGKDCPAAQRDHTVSGYCVPRYVSLRHDQVFGRKGPGKDYPAVYIYHTRGLPVQIVAETEEWRRVCDPEGGAVWVNRTMVDGRRMVLVRGAAPVDLAAEAGGAGKITGRLSGQGLAQLEGCRDAWCKVKAGGVKGWVPAAALWGVDPAPQCH
ncbi:MAG: hypothetical protein KGL69_03590 [Alphaproteobacteria bacterium]|nr:hypothetical protein [Alphaproteobacteria bacterium]